MNPNRLAHIRLTRARFLLTLAALTSSACLGGSNASTPDEDPASPTATRTRRSRTPTPPVETPTPPPPPALELSAAEVKQGSFLTVLVTAAQANRVTATFLDKDYPMGQRIPGGFWGLVGVDALHDTGAFDLSIALVDGDGQPLEPLVQAVDVTDGGFTSENIDVPAEQSELLDPEVAREEAEQLAAAYAIFTPRQWWEGRFVLPAQGNVTSPYGTRRSYDGGPITSYHRGLDIANEEGTPVVAANNGRVVFVGKMQLRGNSIIVDHGFGIFSGYDHLLRQEVELGQDVKKGEQIGLMGTTGLSTGSHLHWEIAVRGTTVDPTEWLEREVVPPTAAPRSTPTAEATATP